jgi:hypothetical protein
MTPMVQIFRDTDGQAERVGYPQISQMTQIPDPGLNNHEATAATLVRNRGYVPLWAPSLRWEEKGPSDGNNALDDLAPTDLHVRT